MQAGEGRAEGGNFGLGPGLASCSLLGIAQDLQGHILGTKNCDGSGQWGGALAAEGQRECAWLPGRAKPGGSAGGVVGH